MAMTATSIQRNCQLAYGASWQQMMLLVLLLIWIHGNVWFYKNGTWSARASSCRYSGIFQATETCLSSGEALHADSVCSVNFGQRPFAYTAPSGFKALCTTNLPEPTIADGSTAMDVALYTGNGSTQTISGLNFSPDLVWIKNRAAADNHKLTDTVRGATEELESNTTDAEVTNADGLTAFNSDGFDLGDDDEYNTSSEDLRRLDLGRRQLNSHQHTKAASLLR